MKATRSSSVSRETFSPLASFPPSQHYREWTPQWTAVQGEGGHGQHRVTTLDRRRPQPPSAPHTTLAYHTCERPASTHQQNKKRVTIAEDQNTESSV